MYYLPVEAGVLAVLAIPLTLFAVVSVAAVLYDTHKENPKQ